MCVGLDTTVALARGVAVRLWLERGRLGLSYDPAAFCLHQDPGGIVVLGLRRGCDQHDVPRRRGRREAI